MKVLSGLNPGRMLGAGLGLVLIAMIAVGAGYATRSHDRAGLDLDPRAGGQQSVRGIVQAVTSDSITVVTDEGPITFKISASTPRDAIRTTTLDAIRPGDWVNAGGVLHNQTIYALTALVVIPAANQEGR